MRKFPTLLTLILLCVVHTTLSGCWSFYKDEDGGNSLNYVHDEAYVPIFGTDSTYRTVFSMPPQPIVQSGKIYVLGSNLFQVEDGRGVHIINYSDKTNPVKIGFIRSGGATEVAVKSGYLIINNAEDLVTIDISALPAIKEVARIKNAFKNFSSQHYLSARPPGKGYYVCPYRSDPANPDVIGWKLEKNVSNAYCRNY